jgi:hypothetical protein
MLPSFYPFEKRPSGMLPHARQARRRLHLVCDLKVQDPTPPMVQSGGLMNRYRAPSGGKPLQPALSAGATIGYSTKQAHREIEARTLGLRHRGREGRRKLLRLLAPTAAIYTRFVELLG